ncbi:MAG: methionine--tRNA ligase [Cytophagales bacterium]|nr:methionine--tRNA ligase [Cytophagales bacterium]
MSKRFKRYIVTSALPYANGPLHIGQIAGAYLPADIYVRYLRLKEVEVVYICGSDEHGVPITLEAKKRGISPQDEVDKYHKLNKKSFEKFGISFDIYHRTSDRLHHETASDFFKKLYDKGILTKEEHEQYYDEENQQFLADRYITGTCPNCSNENAYGDQCERCGSSLSPKELIDPKSVLSGKNPVLRKTSHWYLPLDKFQKEWIEKWIDGHKNDWKTNVYGQCRSWLNEGLKPRAVTRDLDWGVAVPLPDAKGKVLYVWFDAPVGYISATKALTKEWEKYWKDEESGLIHFIGKDNIVFHCIIFPAMLKAHGEYIVPHNVPANEFMNMEGEKISTSRNWAVWLHEYLEVFEGKEDMLRYVLCANMPETKDSDFTWKDFQARSNNELVAILGNFVNRVFVLMNKNFNGIVPADQYVVDVNIDNELNVSCKTEVAKAIENYNFRHALNLVMNLVRAGNKFLSDTEPWKLLKENKTKEAGEILTYCLQIIAKLTIIMEPFLPFTSRKLISMLNLNEDILKWKNIETLKLPKGHKINEPTLLFEKIEDQVIEEQVEKLKGSKKVNSRQ